MLPPHVIWDCMKKRLICHQCFVKIGQTFIVHNFTLTLQRSCFHDSNRWPLNHKNTSFPLCQVSPFYYLITVKLIKLKHQLSHPFSRTNNLVNDSPKKKKQFSQWSFVPILLPYSSTFTCEVWTWNSYKFPVSTEVGFWYFLCGWFGLSESKENLNLTWYLWLKMQVDEVDHLSGLSIFSLLKNLHPLVSSKH